MDVVTTRLKSLLGALPSDSSAVVLSRADLAVLLDEGAAADDTLPERDLTVGDVAAETGRATSTVRGWLLRGELRGYKLNRRDWRVPRAALREYLNSQTAPRGDRWWAGGEVDIGAWRQLKEATTP